MCQLVRCVSKVRLPVPCPQDSSDLFLLGARGPSLAGQQHWTHMSLDFITGLPPSAGNIIIFTTVDHFSKQAHFITQSAICTGDGPANDWWWAPAASCQTVALTLPRRWGKSSAPYWEPRFHPETNGQVQRTNQELQASLQYTVPNLEFPGGTPGWAGSSMRITPWHPQRLGSRYW